MLFASGAVLGLLCTVLSFTKGGFKREESNDLITVRIQYLLAPLTLVVEFILAFPKTFNLFQIGSPAFQKSLLHDGKLLIELSCHSILIGLLAVVLLSVGNFVANDKTIVVCHMMIHFCIMASFMFMITHYADSPSGHFETPAFLHSAVGFSNALGVFQLVKKRLVQYFQSQEHAAVLGQGKEKHA